MSSRDTVNIKHTCAGRQSSMTENLNRLLWHIVRESEINFNQPRSQSLGNVAVGRILFSVSLRLRMRLRDFTKTANRQNADRITWIIADRPARSSVKRQPSLSFGVDNRNEENRLCLLSRITRERGKLAPDLPLEEQLHRSVSIRASVSSCLRTVSFSLLFYYVLLNFLAWTLIELSKV